MKTNSIYRIFIIAAACFPTGIHAQNEEETAVKPAKGRLAYIIYTGRSMLFQKPITIRSGEKNTRLQLSKRSANQPVKVHSDGAMQFIRENPGNEKKPYTVYAKALVPEGVKKALIVLSPLKEAKGDELYSAKVISLSKFRNGDWLFINTTPRNVAVQVGDKKLGMKPGENNTYRAGTLTKSANKTVSYAYYHSVKKKWQLLSSSTCVIRPTRREICVFSWNPKSKRMDYHGITLAENND